MRPPAPALKISEGQRAALSVLPRSQTAAHREVQRAAVLLLAAEGIANEEIARAVSVTPVTVRAWRTRFEEEGLAKLGRVRSGWGRKATIPQAEIVEIVELTQHSKPDGHTHWSVRTMAKASGCLRRKCNGSERRAG